MMLRFASLLVVAALAGCQSMPLYDGARSGPFYRPPNVQGAPKLPETVRRIALLPSAAQFPVTEETLTRIDQSLALGLSHAARAEVTPVTRDQLAYLTGARQWLSTAVLPSNFLSKIDGATGADAVLLIDIIDYSPYPPLRIGIRAKLVQFSTGQVLWAFDNLFDASNPEVTNAARRYHSQGDPVKNPADLSSTILQNPTRFAAYVGAATFATLPPR